MFINGIQLPFPFNATYQMRWKPLQPDCEVTSGNCGNKCIKMDQIASNNGLCLWEDKPCHFAFHSLCILGKYQSILVAYKSWYFNFLIEYSIKNQYT